MPDETGSDGQPAAVIAELRARVAALEGEVRTLRAGPLPGFDAAGTASLLAELREASQERRKMLSQLLQVLGTDVDHLA